MASIRIIVPGDDHAVDSWADALEALQDVYLAVGSRELVAKVPRSLAKTHVLMCRKAIPFLVEVERLLSVEAGWEKEPT